MRPTPLVRITFAFLGLALTLGRGVPLRAGPVETAPAPEGIGPQVSNSAGAAASAASIRPLAFNSALNPAPTAPPPALAPAPAAALSGAAMPAALPPSAAVMAAAPFFSAPTGDAADGRGRSVTERPDAQFDEATRHYLEPGRIVSRSKGITGAHAKSEFEKLLAIEKDGFRQGEVVAEREIPGLNGMERIEYKMRQEEHGRLVDKLKGTRPLVKVVVDERIWTEEKLSRLQEDVFAAKLKTIRAEPGATGTFVVEVHRGPLKYLGWVDKATGKLKSFGIDFVPDEAASESHVANSDPAAKEPAAPRLPAEPEVLGVSDAARALISHYGSYAFYNVWQARQTSGAGRLPVRDEMQGLVGGLKDPRIDPSIDNRLRDIEHYVFAYNGVREALLISPDEPAAFRDEHAVLRAARLTLAAAYQTALVIGYTPVKFLAQTFSRPREGSSLNNPNTSEASWKEIWFGVSGALSGLFQGIGPRQRAADAKKAAASN